MCVSIDAEAGVSTPFRKKNGHESNEGSTARGQQDDNEDNGYESPIPNEITIETQNINGQVSNGGARVWGHQDDNEDNDNESPCIVV